MPTSPPPTFYPPNGPTVPQTPYGPPPSLREQRNVQLNSPLALIGAFIYIIRERFSPPNEGRYQWLDNKSATSVVVEAQFERNTELRDAKPGVYIDRGQTVYRKNTIDNRDQYAPSVMTRRLDQYLTLVETDINIDVVAATKGESATLGNIVMEHIECSRNIIMTFFTLQDISPLIMARTEAFQKDETLFNTPIQFRTTHELRWATLPIAPVMREIVLNGTKQSGSDDAVDFEEIYIQSLDKP
jgi:hypothetical protein